MILISILNVVSITQLQCSIRILNLSNADDSLFNVLNMDSQYVTKSRLASSGTVGPKLTKRLINKTSLQVFQGSGIEKIRLI